MNTFDLLNKLNFNLMIKNLTSWKSWILISWNSTSWPWVIFLRIILPDVYQKIRMIGGDQFDEWCQSVFFLDQFSISLRKIKFEVCKCIEKMNTFHARIVLLFGMKTIYMFRMQQWPKKCLWLTWTTLDYHYKFNWKLNCDQSFWWSKGNKFFVRL
jgi:hypothetical protein